MRTLCVGGRIVGGRVVGVMMSRVPICGILSCPPHRCVFVCMCVCVLGGGGRASGSVASMVDVVL